MSCEPKEFYAHSLKGKHGADTFNGLALSESSLKEDWLSAEEDEAWKHLQKERQNDR